MAPATGSTGIPCLKVAFVCLHGSAKSIIATAQFRNLTAALGLAVEAVALGTEPDPAFPRHVLDGLRGDGLTSRVSTPLAATRESLRDVRWVVSFGPDVTHMLPHGCTVWRWEDVPSVADGYRAASVDIYRRVTLLVDELLRGTEPLNG